MPLLLKEHYHVCKAKERNSDTSGLLDCCSAFRIKLTGIIGGRLVRDYADEKPSA